jgi:hypothetical protein
MGTSRRPDRTFAIADPVIVNRNYPSATCSVIKIVTCHATRHWAASRKHLPQGTQQSPRLPVSSTIFSSFIGWDNHEIILEDYPIGELGQKIAMTYHLGKDL